MKKYDKELIIKQYEESGKIMYETTLSGDYKTCNKEAKKLITLFKYFEQNKEFGMDCINTLLKSKNIVIKSKAAAYCLALNENIDQAVMILEELSKDDSIGIYRLNAEMTLKVWRENGCLKIY